MLIRQAHQTSVLVATIGTFQRKHLSFSCHDVLVVCIDIMCIAINSITILNIHGVDYYCIIFGISKREAINLFKIMLI